MEDAQIAAELSVQLAARIGQERYELWFGPATRFCVASSGLTILAASAFVRDWLRTNFADDIRACCEAIVARPVTIAFEVDEGASAGVAKLAGKCDAKSPAAVTAKPKVRPRKNGVAIKPQAAPVMERELRGVADFTFEQFVAGSGNEYALRSAELTARGLQQASPLMWWGPTGVGKTHLLRAIVREYRRRHPRASAVYLSAEQFTTSFVEAVRGSGLPSFRQKCRGANLLAIDDLQFFVGKARTLEELQYTVDTLLAEGRQLVLASDRPLGELRALGPELSSRLSGGLVCQIEPPEFATRLGILRRLRDDLGIAVDEDVLARVAGQITAGARELRGALHRLQAMSMAFGEPITVEAADEALRELVRQCTRPVRLVDVEHVICDVFGVEASQLRSERKGRSVSEPRMLAMWLARKYTRAAWGEIGQFFGRRSHSTVIAAHRRVERMISDRGEVGLGDRPCRVEEAIRKLESALRTG
jgi:chromosomal replication initiator protein